MLNGFSVFFDSHFFVHSPAVAVVEALQGSFFELFGFLLADHPLGFVIVLGLHAEDAIGCEAPFDSFIEVALVASAVWSLEFGEVGSDLFHDVAFAERDVLVVFK